MRARIYKFADFELVAADGELRSGNSIARLQEKPLLLLCALLDHPDTVVTRRQLRERMWDTETFVDYEQGINVAMKKVRDALGDSAEEPRFIQTIAKKGYRFLVPVEVIELAPVLRPAPVAGHVAVTGPAAPRRHVRSETLGIDLATELTVESGRVTGRKATPVTDSCI